jgi:hypothetical protein
MDNVVAFFEVLLEMYLEQKKKMKNKGTNKNGLNFN